MHLLMPPERFRLLNKDIDVFQHKGRVFMLFNERRPHRTQHYNDVIMSAMASQITGVTTVYSTVYS